MRQRLISLLTITALILSFCSVLAAASPDAALETIHIQSPEDLLELAGNCRLDTWSQGKTVVLDCDLDLAHTDFVPIPTFGGTFRGAGHTICGLSLTDDLSHAGLFRYLQTSAVVQDLTVTGTVAPGGSQSAVGSLAGTNFGTIRNCAFSGAVADAMNVGGLVGINEESGTITGCTVTGTVTGETYTGGIAGYNLGTISDCENSASVNISITKTDFNLDELNLEDLNSTENVPASTDTGGIAGYSSGTVQGCVNRGKIGYPHYGYNVGGIAGRQSGFLSDCDNYGLICGRKEVGGIVGQMEPHMEIQMSSSLAQELQSLHDLVAKAITDAGAETEDITAALDQIHASAGNAFSSASSLANQTTDFVNDTVEDVNEISTRIDETIQGLAPVTAELNGASSELHFAIDSLQIAMDNMELGEDERESLHTNLDALSDAMQDINAATTYLAYLGAAYNNAENDGTTDLDAMRPENYEEIQAEYGYDYTITKKHDIKDAYIQPVSDLIGAAGRASQANAVILDVLNDYYLTDIYDTDEDGTPDQNRLEFASESGNAAMDAFGQAGDHLNNASAGLSALHASLSSKEPVEFSTLDSAYYQTTDALFSELSAISGGLSALGGVIREGSAVIQEDFLAINDQFNRVMLLVINAITGDTNEEILQDVSLDDTEADTEGKVADCHNYGEVSGDINVGGVCGAQAIEYDYDLESDVTGGLAGANKIFSSTYLTKCIIRRCENRGTIMAKKDGAGGISGLMELGAVLDSSAYGSISSTDGSNVGGIAGYSYTAIRDSYAMCSLAGLDHVGGIAGFGHDISGCYSLIGIAQVSACTGAIAGEADGTLEQNYFVHETLGGVDGISYQGAAEPITYQQLSVNSQVPDDFRKLTLTFTADGEVVKTITFSYGASIDESELPEVPEKEGYTGSWPVYNYNCLYFSDTIEAVYISQLTTLATDQTGADSDKALALVEGRFGPNASVLLTESTAEGPGEEAGTVLAQWLLQVDTDLDTGVAETRTIRVLKPETEQKGAGTAVYVRQNGQWKAVPATVNGSYLVFDAGGDAVEFCIVETGRQLSIYAWMGISMAALVVVLVAAAVLRKKRKEKAKTPEEASAESEKTPVQ